MILLINGAKTLESAIETSIENSPTSKDSIKYMLEISEVLAPRHVKIADFL